MATDAVIGERRRKFSKNKKRNWRKFTNIQDIEESLDERRRVDRLGGPASDKADNDLFVISSQPSSVGGRLPGKTSLQKHKPLRSEMHLVQTTSFDSSEDDVTPPGRRILGGKRRPAKGVDSDTFRLSPPQHKVNRKPRDLWNDDVGGADELEDEHYLRTTRRKLPKMPKTLADHRRCIPQAIEVDHPGASYNPPVEQHKKLLKEAARQKEEWIKNGKKVKRWFSGLASLDQQQREEVWLDEITEGLFDDVPSASEDSGSEDEVLPKRPIRAEDRKTIKQRQKERRVKEEINEQKLEKLKRIREAGIYRLKTYKKEIRQKEAAMLEKMKARKVQKEENLQKTHRLGRLKYAHSRVIVKPSSEIRKPLRILKSEGSIVRDRYKSLQKRNMIEPRRKAVRRRKYKLKEIEKRSCRIPLD